MVYTFELIFKFYLLGSENIKEVHSSVNLFLTKIRQNKDLIKVHMILK